MKKVISCVIVFVCIFTYSIADVIDPVLNEEGIAEHHVEEVQDITEPEIDVGDIENIFYSYVVAENKMGSVIPVYGDKELKEQIYDITKDGANILFYDSENNHIYHVAFIDQNGNVFTGYVDLFGKDFTKLTETEAATMSSLGVTEKKVNGEKTILFPTEIKVFIKETATPTTKLKPTQKPRTTRKPANSQSSQRPSKPTNADNGSDTSSRSTQNETSVAQTSEEPNPDKQGKPMATTAVLSKESQRANSETKSVSLPTEDELRALGYTEPVDYSQYYLIGGGALVLIILLIVIVKIIKKHKKPKRSLL